MSSIKFLAAVAGLGLTATACSYSSTTTEASLPPTVPASSAEGVCMDYGFRPGTDAYNHCVVREADARARGRVSKTYPMASVTADARAACSSYGLMAGTATYDRCVSREVDARRYRQEATVTTYASPATGTTTTVYSATPPAPAAPPPAATTPPAGVQVFRDEYGFRYDGQGNRLDARGNIISPQSTSP
ncbi:MAG: hypothetical protein ACOY4R_22790 [Pseudomonadota bacterium]